MGAINSKRKLNGDIPPLLDSSVFEQLQNDFVKESTYNNEILNKLRKQLNNDIPTFLLNNLLLSVQFFENYDKDIADLRLNNVSTKETGINNELSVQQKHCLMPDTLHELVDRRVRYKRDKQYYSETLHVQKMLIAYDNVEVRHPSETSEYSSPLEGPIYRCVTSPSNLLGYVELKLQAIEIKTKGDEKERESDSPKVNIIRHFSFNNKDIYEYGGENGTDDVFMNKRTSQDQMNIRIGNDQVIKRMNLPAAVLNQKQDSDYTKITEHYTPKPLFKRLPSENYSATNLPGVCITTIHEQVFDDSLYEKTHDVKLFEKIAYLNSAAFKLYFYDIFPRHVAELLGFDGRCVDTAMMQDAIIYVNKMETKHLHHYEVVPSFTSSWPDEAYAWSLRSRPVIQDVQTQTAYRWPTQGMINRVVKLPCHIYPTGFMPKHGDNELRDLQWRLAFPAAERFLESHLFHAQIRCYLFTLALHKTFIEPNMMNLDATKLGLTSEHIRTHLFWECEKNYVRWPETRLGEKLKTFLEHLRRHLSVQNLPDFFIPGRNLFENIPSKKLHEDQYRIVKILENPVMHVLEALRNLKYTERKFYPTLNYKRLYDIITTDNPIFLMNPNIPQVIITTQNNDEEDSDESTDDNNIDVAVRWYSEAYKRIQQEKLNKKPKDVEQKPRVSINSINFEIVPEKTLDIMRQILVLKLFISHFIEMAKTSNVFNAPQQGMMYIDHATNLNTLLSEIPSGEEDSTELQTQIINLENIIRESSSSSPRTPRMNTSRNIVDKYRGKNFNIYDTPARPSNAEYVNIIESIDHPKEQIVIVKADIQNEFKTCLILNTIEEDLKEESTDL